MKTMDLWLEGRNRRPKRLWASTKGRGKISPFHLHRESPADDQRLRYFLNQETEKLGERGNMFSKY